MLGAIGRAAARRRGLRGRQAARFARPTGGAVCAAGRRRWICRTARPLRSCDVNHGRARGPRPPYSKAARHIHTRRLNIYASFLPAPTC